MAAAKKGGLGRGLDALFADVPVAVQPATADADTPKGHEDEGDSGERVRYIPIHEIMPNANQPRKVFQEEKIEELAASIREHGILQPIIVRKQKTGYEIVAGERRWRAAMRAGLKQAPCLVRELTDAQNMLVAIIENMQREDLNPIEEAEGLQQMMTAFGLTQEEVSRSVGKSRPYIANSVRLLKLPAEVRAEMETGAISAGHGRALLAVSDAAAQQALCQRIIREGLSVREAETLAAGAGKGKAKRTAKRVKDPDTAKAEEELKAILGTRVSITERGQRGRIEIECFSREELNRLVELLKRLA